MLKASEHFYHDDPNVGPRDVRTELRNVEYFFLGNGRIQVAVQWAPAGDGTPLGLLVMDPDKLRTKRKALTMDDTTGLAPTMIRVTLAGTVHEPGAGACDVRWATAPDVPTVVARWRAGALAMREEFFCPEWDAAVVVRRVTLRNTRRVRVVAQLTTGVKQQTVRRRLALDPGATAEFVVRYTLDTAADAVRCTVARRAAIDAPTRAFWAALARVRFGHPMLDGFFRAAVRQLPAGVSRTGCVDGSIWQYNREWLRDQAVIALALTMVGATDLATTMFTRLLDKFVTPDGDTVDSSERRDPSEVELDQNGLLLCTLKDYVLWTGNVDLVRANWAKVVATAEYPLRPVFRHPESGLLMNCREFWERHRIHGIQPGIEMVYQLYVAHGLAAAAVLARLTGNTTEAERWDREGARLKQAMLEHPRFRMHDARGFLKRRLPNGRVQECTADASAAQLPAEAPLARPGRHYLNPDTSAALPIALGTIPPNSPLAKRTMKTLETLWNQDWTGGGYGRYHVTSEADSPGGWPFPSLFVARAAVEMGDDAKAWRVLDWLGRINGARAGTWFEFYGRRIAPPFPQVGLVVWNWAELIVLVVHHLLGVRPGEDGLTIQPHMLRGIAGATATLRWRGHQLRLRAKRQRGGAGVHFTCRGAPTDDRRGGFVIARRA